MDQKTKHLVARTLLQAAEVLESKFADEPRKKNVWERFTVQDLRSDEELAEELFLLIQQAYAPIGGHATIRSPQDLMKEATFFNVIDVDHDPDPDAILLVRKKAAGEKHTGMGHDGTRPAKDAVLKERSKLLKRKGHFVEVSGASAHIFLTKFDVPIVTDEATVREVLNKPITWVGARPDGKYPKATGWYERVIGSGKHLKIMLGIPLRP